MPDRGSLLRKPNTVFRQACNFRYSGNAF